MLVSVRQVVNGEGATKARNQDQRDSQKAGSYYSESCGRDKASARASVTASVRARVCARAGPSVGPFCLDGSREPSPFVNGAIKVQVR